MFNNRLEAIHNEGDSPEVVQLREEVTELRASLSNAEAAICGERRLVSVLHDENTKLKVSLL